MNAAPNSEMPEMLFINGSQNCHSSFKELAAEIAVQQLQWTGSSNLRVRGRHSCNIKLKMFNSLYHQEMFSMSCKMRWLQKQISGCVWFRHCAWKNLLDHISLHSDAYFTCGGSYRAYAPWQHHNVSTSDHVLSAPRVDWLG